MADAEERLCTVEKQLYGFKLIATLALGLAGGLAVVGLWLQHSIADLGKNYAVLSAQYTQLQEQAKQLKADLPKTSHDVMKDQFPGLFAEEMKTLIHNDDHITLVNTNAERTFQTVDRVAPLTLIPMPNKSREHGIDQMMTIVKWP